jgi:hypothetical protein
MITREQAEKSFHERYDQPNSILKPEIRNLSMEEIDTEYLYSQEESLGQFDIEDRGWLCTFETRYRELHLGEWTGRYSDWRKMKCYIVEPKPGPYVID